MKTEIIIIIRDKQAFRKRGPTVSVPELGSPFSPSVKCIS